MSDIIINCFYHYIKPSHFVEIYVPREESQQKLTLLLAFLYEPYSKC